MAEHDDREHYIPIRKADLVDLLCGEGDLSAQDQDRFRQLCTLTEAMFHFEYHKQLDELKNAYAPFDPDSETNALAKLSDADRGSRLTALFDKFVWLLGKANFMELKEEDIRAALEGSSAWGINMSVDFSVFERYHIFIRGDSLVTRYRRPWWKLFRQEGIDLPTYKRLIMILKLRPHKRLGSDIDTEGVYLKVFKDIPKDDLEMLLPGTSIQMTKMDKGLIFYPLLMGLGLLLWKVGESIWADVAGGTAILAGAAGLATWGMLGVFGGYGYKSYYSYTVKKTKYSLQLTKSLYFQNLDSNAGVLFRLLDEAEEQECREAFLGYYFLWRKAGADGWTSEQLDDHIEEYIEKKTGLKVDFEIGDALEKCVRLGMVEQGADGRVRAKPIAQALEALDNTWDNFFKYNAG
jgi:hypothetical protein